MSKAKLSKQDWLAAGFRALAANGPMAIKAEALARTLKTTKGSFYWHFADLAAFKEAMLALWRDKVAIEVIDDVMAQNDKRMRLRVLVENAARPAPEEFGGRKIETAIRAWALSDPNVSSSLKEMDELRMNFLEQLLEDAGMKDPILAQLVYGAYIGLDDLASKERADIRKSLSKLIDMIE